MDDRLQEILKRVWPEWKLEKKIGGGSFGTVWQAVRRDLAGESRAAIKVIMVPQGDEDINAIRAEGYSPGQTSAYFRKVVADYTKEIQLLDSVKGYTNIVGIENYKIIHSEEEDRWYIFIRMELLQRVDYRSMQEVELVQLGIEICTALTVCREKNIVHRDIKPDNILMNDTGHYKLSDFGVARSLGATTNRMSVKGTPNYMAPEVYKAVLQTSDIDAAAKADIYSLGMVMYWIGNGTRLPFMPEKQIPSMNDREEAFSRRIGGEELPPPAKVSVRLQEIILKACAYDPADRYGSAVEMRADLERLRQGTAPIPAMEPAEKPRRTKKLFVSVAALIVLVGLLCALILPRVLNPEGKDDEGTVQQTAENMVHFTLTIPDGLADNDDQMVRDILKGRLDKLANGKVYRMEENSGQFDVFFPADAFGDGNIANILRCYITRPTNLYLQENKDSDEYLEVPRDALETVMVKTGTIPGVEATEYGITDLPYEYIILTLTDEFINEYGQRYAAWEEPVFSQDRVEFPHYYFYHTTFPAGDGKTFYLLNHESSGQEIFTELVAFNLNNRVYPTSFTYVVDLNDRVEWETVRPDGESGGKLQRNADELGDETVTFSLLHSGDKPTEGQLLDLRKALRENLDAIGRPYAIGLSKESEDDSFFAIKTLPDRMNTEIAELLSGSFHLAVRSGQYETSVYSLSLRLEKAGENGLTLSGEGWNWDSLRKDIRQLGESADPDTEELLLSVAKSRYDFPILRISVKDAVGSEDVLPVELCRVTDGQITAMERTKENEWLVDLLQSVLENYTRLSYLSLEEWKMNPDSEGNVTGPDRLLPSLYSDGAEISRIVHEIVPGADLLYRQGYLQIFLDLTADEQYARKSVELTDRLYRALMPKGFFAEEIWIIFKEENNSVFERARIIFDRRYGTVQSSGEAGKPGGKYYCNLIVGGGETEKYAGEIEESFKQLDWYQEIEKMFSD